MVISGATNPPLAGWGLDVSPFHDGELAVQKRLGIAHAMDSVGRRVIRRFMPAQHREFFAVVPFIVLGAASGQGQLWATMLAGAPGFVQSPDEKTLHIMSVLLPAEPLMETLEARTDVGLLGIDLSSRRRNRMNGRMEPVGVNEWTVGVAQSFGNCPKYIQGRRVLDVQRGDRPPRQLVSLPYSALTTEDQRLLAASDIFFVATHSGHRDGPTSGADVSHRGGRPGFVRVEDDRRFIVPDFEGNSFYNTLGNLVARPQAGLLFIDWTNGDMLHVCANADIVWDVSEALAYPGAKRFIRFSITEVVRRSGAFPFRAPQHGNLSPFVVGVSTETGSRGA